MGWLIETAPTTLTLTEGVGGKLVAKGLFGICGVPTANGRVYPKPLIEREIKKLSERMRKRQVLGHVDHPENGRTSLMQASHLVTKLSLDGDNVIGEAEILNTPSGKILKALCEANVTLGVSSRGFGSTKPTESGDVVGEDFVLATYDFVADPSVRTALPKMFWESVEQVEQVSPLEMFRAEFPDAMAELTEAATRDAVERAKEQAAAIVEKAVEAERTRVRTELSEAFERQLKDALVGLREDLTKELREEYEADPAVAGAKAALAQIVEMVGAYRQTQDEAAVKDALKAAELAVAAAKGAQEQAEGQAAQAGRLLKLEQTLAGNPLAGALRKVLAPVVVQRTDEALDAELGSLVEEAAALVPQAQVEERVTERMALTEAREQVEESKQERSQLLEQVEELRAKLSKAVEIGHTLDENAEEAKAAAEAAEAQVECLEAKVAKLELEVYKRESVVGLANQRKVLSLLEGADSKAKVDAVVGASGAKAMVDGDLERARKAIRGVAPGSDAFRLEEGARARGVPGASEDAVDRSGLTADGMALLSGVRPEQAGPSPPRSDRWKRDR